MFRTTAHQDDKRPTASKCTQFRPQGLKNTRTVKKLKQHLGRHESSHMSNNKPSTRSCLSCIHGGRRGIGPVVWRTPQYVLFCSSGPMSLVPLGPLKSGKRSGAYIRMLICKGQRHNITLADLQLVSLGSLGCIRFGLRASIC